MANEPSTTPGKAAERPKPQRIPLAKIHDLPGTFISKPPDRTYGGLVNSIQAVGVTEPVILRQREDGEYQLLAGYRRRRASELAKQQDIPAYVYEMTMQEALAYHQRQKNQPDAPIPGKLLSPPAPAVTPAPKKEEAPASAATAVPKQTDARANDGKKADAPAPAATAVPKQGDAKAADGKKAETPPSATTAAPKQGDTKAADGKKAETPPSAATATPKQGDAKATDKKKAETPAPAATAAAKQRDTKAADGKKAETLAPAVPAAPKQTDAKAADGKKAETSAPAAPADPKQTDAKVTDGKKAEAPASAAPAVPKQGDAKAADGKKAETSAPAAPATSKQAAAKTAKESAAAPSGPAAAGPTGTAITQLFDARLAPPDEKALKGLPIPKEGDSYFISLHPGYLKKSKFNTFSVDRDSDNFKELYKAIELSGIKDPVLARPMADGGLEILSGQRRHLIGSELNYPIPTIIQQIDDDDAKIMVADSNLHRDKISTYDLSRALRMKADGMKRKAGRRRKNDPSVPLLNTNEALAREMGMPVSKLDRIIRLSEATKEVCGRYDEGRLELSIAHSISFLKPKNQDLVMHLSDLGYKVSTVRVERMKKVEKAGRLTEQAMRDILDDKDIAPKTPTVQSGNATIATPAAPPVSPTTPNQSSTTAVPAAPAAPSAPAETPPAGDDKAQGGEANSPAEESDVFKGAQERPENVKVILTGDRLRRYYPDVTMTPREIEEDIYDKLDRCKKMDERQAAKNDIFKKPKGQER